MTSRDNSLIWLRKCNQIRSKETICWRQARQTEWTVKERNSELIAKVTQREVNYQRDRQFKPEGANDGEPCPPPSKARSGNFRMGKRIGGRWWEMSQTSQRRRMHSPLREIRNEHQSKRNWGLHGELEPSSSLSVKPRRGGRLPGK